MDVSICLDRRVVTGEGIDSSFQRASADSVTYADSACILDLTVPIPIRIGGAGIAASTHISQHCNAPCCRAIWSEYAPRTTSMVKEHHMTLSSLVNNEAAVRESQPLLLSVEHASRPTSFFRPKALGMRGHVQTCEAKPS